MPSVTKPIATQTITTLSGHVAMPATVSGVATAPIEMPSAMKQARDRSWGRNIGRPASAATAEKTMAPASQPAGNPAKLNSVPPAAAISSVSVTWSARVGTGTGMTIGGCMRPSRMNRKELHSGSMTREGAHVNRAGRIDRG